MTETQTLATRYTCLSQGSIRCMGDLPKCAKCKACGGSVYVQHGLWGVYTWRGDGRYMAVDEHRKFARKSAADKLAVANEWVTRWIPA